MDKESASERLELRQAECYIQFINVELYTNPDYYSPKIGMEYFIWSDKKCEFEKYSITPELRWEDLEIYFENELLYIR